MTVVNPLRHPQTLFLGFPEDDIRLVAMREMVGESRVIGTSGFNELRGKDWDLLVAESVKLTDLDVPDHVYILAFNCEGMGRASGSMQSRFNGPAVLTSQEIYYLRDQFSQQLFLPSDSADAVTRLVQTETIPALKDASPMPHLNIRTGEPRRFRAKHCRAFLTDADDNVVAGEFLRAHSEALCWALPHASKHPSLWLMAALETWHQRDSKRFPDASPWRDNPRWMTVDEREAQFELQALKADWLAAEARYASLERDLTGRLMDARTAADKGMRRLLTEQGESLVIAVAEALERLGFKVIDRDSERVAGNLGKVEDLEIVDPSRDELTIIAEVKGYRKRGASQKDLLQLSNHATAFAVRHHRAPDRRWYIVNQFAQDVPDKRPTPLAAAKEHREVFADSGGLVIDTRCLFQLARDVANGSFPPESARRLLVDSRDVLEYTSADV